MKKLIILFLIALLNFPLYAANSKTGVKRNLSNRQTTAISAVVDPGMELLAIMLWLSGNYPQPLDSSYKSDVWKHFSKYRQHPAILKMKKVRFYPDFTENGLLLTGFPSIKYVQPASNRWDETIGKGVADATLSDAVKFAADTKFSDFYIKHQKDYRSWTDKFGSEVQKKELMQTVESFFGASNSQSKPRVTIYLEPLNYWGAHAIDFQKFIGEPVNARISFQLGASDAGEQFPDSPLTFVTNTANTKTIWHEATHIYLFETLKRNQQEIGSLSKFFNAPDLKSQNILTWDYAFEENLVRAIVGALTRKKFGEDAYKQETNSQRQRGFIYTPALAELIYTKYLNDQAKYSSFEDFMPEIFALLDEKGASLSQK